jgi:hypothetical protein
MAWHAPLGGHRQGGARSTGCLGCLGCRLGQGSAGLGSVLVIIIIIIIIIIVINVINAIVVVVGNTGLGTTIGLSRKRCGPRCSNRGGRGYGDQWRW